MKRGDMPEEKVKQYECLCPCEHETGCIACENGNHDYHIVPPAADAGPRQPELTTEEQEINALAPGTIRLPKGAHVPQEGAPTRHKHTWMPYIRSCSICGQLERLENDYEK